jgi:hypothetical protein
MKQTIRNLFLVSCFLFTVSYDCCTLGVDYDKRYKISPEIDSSNSCIISFPGTYSYGRRWERVGFVTFSAGTILSIVGVICWRRKQ